jgi:hypothetical protein
MRLRPMTPPRVLMRFANSRLEIPFLNVPWVNFYWSILLAVSARQILRAITGSDVLKVLRLIRAYLHLKNASEV